MERKIELLNSEGPILIAKRKLGSYLIYDRHKTNIGIRTHQQFIDFLSGKDNLIDSDGKEWNFPSQSEGMRASQSEINIFLKETNYES